MKLSEFDYNLPRELIAQYPLQDRQSARLMVLDRKSGRIEHRLFGDIIDYFNKGDLLVLNDTRVLPARLFGLRPTGGKVEILLLGRKSGLTFKALIRPGRLKLKEKVSFPAEGARLPDGQGSARDANKTKIYAEITAKNEVTFYAKNLKEIYARGVMPLPPYIKRNAQISDNDYYQTVYARRDGSIAAPTAGLHFTKALMCKMRALGINTASITLHIGYSTFKPVKCEDIREHLMEPEYFSVPGTTARLIDKARLSGGRIFATGTTSLRALETYASGIKKGDTGLFIYPGYKFKLADCLLTNFHLPRTTLFMLVCAFAKCDLIKKAYQQAIDSKYRFYSYGDAMLII